MTRATETLRSDFVKWILLNPCEPRSTVTIDHAAPEMTFGVVECLLPHGKA